MNVKNVFLAAGQSKKALDDAFLAETAMKKRLHAFQDEQFGPHTNPNIRIYGDQPELVTDTKGHFVGFRFAWNLDETQTIEDKLFEEERDDYEPEEGADEGMPTHKPPFGWIPVISYPGVYKPDPQELPDIAKICAGFIQPDFCRLPALSGGQPAITVAHQAGEYPRAHESWPEIHDTESDKYYIEVPIDYKGKIIRPLDSKRVSEMEWHDFLYKQQQENGDEYEPLTVGEWGTTFPIDYNDEEEFSARSDGFRYFVLQGSALDIYAKYLTDEAEAHEAVDRLVRAIWGAKSCAHNLTDLYYAKFENDPGEGWILSNDGKDYYTFDLDTEKGRSMKEDFADLPQRLVSADLQKRLTPDTPDASTPCITEFQFSRQKKFLVASYPEAEKVVPPPDSIEISSAAYYWFKEDYTERITGVESPSIPEEIALDPLTKVSKQLVKATPTKLNPPPRPS